ncbi:hypothetical protein FYL10_09755 [Lactobacillus salivarius]|uniref:Uncharacterized protein n=1 Tax=Ligilactobacillus salivarius TaxID=1624 RepID=A0ABD6J813_9LACO|nr:hypothetical protein [Ligilactobacillus salivarius]MYV11300.1 hypothetical protein [Ligilactobacillus salivarius]MYY21102.1 hypothetical protein [Ligilactobacillus salivarius]MYY73898.1 hypothetical protein [Ligilactobacillus salivarius]
MTTFKKLKYDSNLKPNFSKGKAPSDEMNTSEDKTSDDLDINYLHQRINRMLEINNIQELQNELENVIKITHLMQN